MEGPTAAAAEEKSLLVINDADNADSDFESSRTDAKAKNPRREGSPLSNRSDSLHSTPLQIFPHSLSIHGTAAKSNRKRAGGRRS